MTHAHAAKLTREKQIAQASRETFDIILIGGGIHGASICREAALRGYRTLLLEGADYAYGTSSRSTKILHGGLRYLQHGNIRMVGEALRERAVARRAAPHLTRVQQFLFPIVPEVTPNAFVIRMGLALYDFLAFGLGRARIGAGRITSVRHRKLDRYSEWAQFLREMGLEFKSLFRYCDVQVDDARFVIENISRQHHTRCHHP